MRANMNILCWVRFVLDDPTTYDIFTQELKKIL